MINKNQECDIISDLLPLYMEHKTGKESNEFIKMHVEQCEECRKNMQFMEASYEELLQEGRNETSNRSRQESTCTSAGVGRKRRYRKSVKMFKKAKGKIFICAYLFVLFCFWLYMIFVLL